MIRRFARPMLATVFVIDGIETLRNPQAHAANAAPLVDKAAPLVEKGEQAVNEHVTTSVPPVNKDTETWVKGLAGVKVGAGVLFGLGKAPRISALALTASHVPTTMVRNAFWSESDPDARSRKTTGFATDVALLGALMLASIDTAGQPGLGWRARQAGDKVAAKLPGAKAESAAAGAAITGVAHNLADQAREVGDTVREKAPVVADQVRHQATDIAEKVREKAPEVAEEVRDRSAVAKAHAGPIAAQLRDRASAAANVAADQAAEMQESAREGAASARAVAAEQADKLDTKDARKTAKKVRKNAKATKKDAVKAAEQKKAQAKKKSNQVRKKTARALSN